MSYAIAVHPTSRIMKGIIATSAIGAVAIVVGGSRICMEYHARKETVQSVGKLIRLIV